MALGGEDPATVHERLAATPGNRTVSNGYTFVAHSPELIADGSYFYGWSHQPIHELRLPSRTFTVSVLRDPIKRVCSHYQMLLFGTETPYPFAHPPEEADAAKQGFEHFLGVLPREDLLRQLFMFSKTFDIDEAIERLRACSHVFFTERYEEGLAALAAKLHLPLTMRRERTSARRVELSPDHQDLLREQLQPEYEMISRFDAQTFGNVDVRQ
jgi:hypothetical protein